MTTVNDTNDIIQCQLCNYEEESNGNMLYIDECKHTFHISCIIDNSCEKGLICPCCNIKYKDSRISVAIAFKCNSINMLSKALTYQ